MRTGTAVLAESFSVCRSTDHSVVLSPVSFCLQAGEVVGITGASGSGKTTLLASIGGLLNLYLPGASTQGHLKVFGHDGQSREPRSVAFVSDSPYSQLSGLKTRAIEEAAIPQEMSGVGRTLMQNRCSAALKTFGLLGKERDRLEWLSGGELERLHCATAIGSGAKLILLDQPYAELDAKFQEQLPAKLRAHARSVDGVVLLAFSKGEASYNHFDSVIELETEPTAPAQEGQPAPELPSISRMEIAGTSPWIVRVDDLWFRYGPSEPWLVSGLSVKLGRGDGAIVLGENGAGKTTFLRLLVGILRPSKGTISFTNVGRALESGRWPYGVSAAFQNPDPYFSFPTVQEEIDRGARSDSCLQKGDLTSLLALDRYLAENPLDLPRAARKRLSLAIATLSARRLLLLDEPSQYQDVEHVERIAILVRSVLNSGLAVAFSTHDRRLSSRLKNVAPISLCGAKTATEWRRE